MDLYDTQDPLLKQAEFDWSSKLQGKIDGLQRIEIFFKGKYCETLHMAV